MEKDGVNGFLNIKIFFILIVCFSLLILMMSFVSAADEISCNINNPKICPAGWSCDLDAGICKKKMALGLDCISGDPVMGGSVRCFDGNQCTDDSCDKSKCSNKADTLMNGLDCLTSDNKKGSCLNGKCIDKKPSECPVGQESIDVDGVQYCAYCSYDSAECPVPPAVKCETKIESDKKDPNKMTLTIARGGSYEDSIPVKSQAKQGRSEDISVVISVSPASSGISAEFVKQGNQVITASKKQIIIKALKYPNLQNVKFKIDTSKANGNEGIVTIRELHNSLGVRPVIWTINIKYCKDDLSGCSLFYYYNKVPSSGDRDFGLLNKADIQKTASDFSLSYLDYDKATLLKTKPTQVKDLMLSTLTPIIVLYKDNKYIKKFSRSETEPKADVVKNLNDYLNKNLETLKKTCAPVKPAVGTPGAPPISIPVTDFGSTDLSECDCYKLCTYTPKSSGSGLSSLSSWSGFLNLFKGMFNAGTGIAKKQTTAEGTESVKIKVDCPVKK